MSQQPNQPNVSSGIQANLAGRQGAPDITQLVKQVGQQQNPSRPSGSWFGGLTNLGSFVDANGQMSIKNLDGTMTPVQKPGQANAAPVGGPSFPVPPSGAGPGQQQQPATGLQGPSTPLGALPINQQQMVSGMSPQALNQMNMLYGNPSLGQNLFSNMMQTPLLQGNAQGAVSGGTMQSPQLGNFPYGPGSAWGMQGAGMQSGGPMPMGAQTGK